MRKKKLVKQVSMFGNVVDENTIVLADGRIAKFKPTKFVVYEENCKRCALRYTVYCRSAKCQECKRSDKLNGYYEIDRAS